MPRRDLGGRARAGIPTLAGQACSRGDVDLLRDVARGDRAAFGELYDRLSPVMLALAQRMLGTQREAEDLVHDVFIECWQSAAQYDPSRGSVRAWFMVRTRSRALDRMRAVRRAAAVPLDEELLGRLVARPSQAMAHETSALRRVLLQLSSDQRAVVELGYFAGYSCAEIAVALAIPAGTVKSRMSRALERLRVLLQGYEGAHS